MADEFTGPHKRAEDQQLPWRIARGWAKWSWLIGPIAYVALFMGVKLTGPSDGIAATNRRVDSIRAAQLTLRDTVIAWHDDRIRDSDDLRHMVEFVVRAKCSEMTSQAISALGGNDACDAAEHPLEHAIKAGLRAPASRDP